jgi:hypothetical protein
MRSILIAAVATILPLGAAPASAQWAGFVDTSPPITAPLGSGNFLRGGGGDTPTMWRQRVHLADQLRAEVRDMLAANDGELTDKQVAYIRKRVRRINGNRLF